MTRPRARLQNGLTLIELSVVVAVAGVLLALAMPAFTDFFARRRVEGVANELGTDLQYARSEAISARRNVRVTFVGDRCYVIHRDTLAVDSCVTSGNGLLKTVQLPASSTASFAAAPAFVAFEPVRGLATTPGTVTVGSSVGTARLQVAVSALGRNQLCAPAGHAMTGYKNC